MQTLPAPSPPAFPPPTAPPARRPRRGRVAWVAAGALLAALAVAAGLLALDGGSGRATAFAIDRAPAATAATKYFEFEVAVGGDDGVDLGGTMDVTSGLVQTTFDVPMLGAGEVEVLLDTRNLVVYASTDAVTDLLPLPIEAGYVTLDLGSLAGSGVVDVPAIANPLDVAQLLASADDAVEVGDDEIDGESVRQYRVTVGPATSTAQDPEIGELIESLGIELPGGITFDVWVTETSELRRIRYELPGEAGAASYELDIRPLAEAPDIEVPADSETLDLTEVLGG